MSAGESGHLRLMQEKPTGSSPAFGPPTVAEGHPPVPPQAMSVLAMHVNRGPKQPIMWWHKEKASWDAVLYLHRAGTHEVAAELAVLLDWCDQHGTPGLMWSIQSSDEADQ